MQLKKSIQRAVTAAHEVMERHLFALNERNTLALAATVHFPHFRLVGTELKVWETADRYFDDFKACAGENWAYTKLTPIKSIWVITEINGMWAAQLRSSFAPA